MPIPLSKQLSPEELATKVDVDLKNLSVLITGGASGLGAGIAFEFAKRGAYVTLADVNEPLGVQYCKELQDKGFEVKFIKTDVTSWEEQVAAFKTAISFSPSQASIDIVVAAAGVFGSPFLASNEKSLSLEQDPPKPDTTALDINSTGSFYTAHLAYDYFRKTSQHNSRSKSLILIASLAAYFDIPGMASYTASKYAVRGLFRSIRSIFADHEMRVNLIGPWIVETPLVVEWVKMFKAVGAPVGDVKDVYNTALRCAASEINGRAFACGPRRSLDLGDDHEGADSSTVMRTFYKSELPDWNVMEKKMKQLLGM